MWLQGRAAACCRLAHQAGSVTGPSDMPRPPGGSRSGLCELIFQALGQPTARSRGTDAEGHEGCDSQAEVLQARSGHSGSAPRPTNNSVGLHGTSDNIPAIGRLIAAFHSSLAEPTARGRLLGIRVAQVGHLMTEIDIGRRTRSKSDVKSNGNCLPTFLGRTCRRREAASFSTNIVRKGRRLAYDSRHPMFVFLFHSIVLSSFPFLGR